MRPTLPTPAWPALPPKPVRWGCRLLALAAAVFAVLGSVPGPARAERHALLVGVSEYRDRDAWATLSGTPNDIPAVHAALLKRGFPAANVTVLADRVGRGGEGIRPKGLPTRQAILDEFARLGQVVRPGDQVFLLLGGHGEQQRASGSEALRQVFIPIDAGPSSRDFAPIRNSILDDEIIGFLDKLRAVDAEVWLVIDACHSGGMTRSADGVAVPRPPPPREDRVPEDGARFAGGKVVAFLSAQPSEQVKEVSVATGGEPVSYGPLSLFVAQVLASDGGFTYQDAALRVLAGFDASRRDVPWQSMPRFKGDLGRAIFGGPSRTAGPESWPATFDGLAVRIDAGRLSGLEPGREILLSGASDRRQDGAPPPPLARAVVQRTDLAQSFAKLVQPAAAPLPGYMLARVAEPVATTRLRVALPSGLAEAVPQPAWLAALAGRLAHDDRFVLVADGEAEYRLAATPAGLWVVSPESSIAALRALGGQAIPLSEPADAVADRVVLGLEQLARRDRLLRLTEQSPGTRSARNLVVELLLLRAPVPDAPPRSSPPGSAPPACTEAPATVPDGAVPVAADAIPDLRHCDTLYIRLRNTGRNPLDLGLCYIDGVGRVETADQLLDLRLPPRQDLPAKALQVRSWDRRGGGRPSVGAQRLVVIAVERQDSASLPFPLQISPALCPRTMATRSVAQQNATEEERRVLAALGGPGARTRQAAGAAPTLDGSIVRTIRWNQLPYQ